MRVQATAYNRLLPERGVKYQDEDDEEAQVDEAEQDSGELVILRKLYEEGRKEAERPCCSGLKLATHYFYIQGSKLVAIWFWQFLFFYLDVVLDISVLKVFAKNGDYHFILVSIGGIILGTLYCLVEMIRGMGPPDPPWLLLVLGFLLIPQGHVFALCVYSTIMLKGPHPMLLSFKLAESALEATVSSVIQTYSSIFRHLSAHDQAITYISISTSYLSIAYAFTLFDHRQKGLHDLPGLCEHWLSPLSLVFLFRVCEVCSRIASLGLLQRATRNEIIASGFSLQTYGCVVVIGLDFIIMLVLTAIYQCGRAGKGHWKNVQFSIISVVAYINPLLLKDNAYTIPCTVYYGVRLLELIGMGALAYKTERLHCANQIDLWHTQNEPPAPICKKFQHSTFVGVQAFKEEFWDDDIPMVAFIVSTLLMYILLPIIRCAFADNVLMRNTSMYHTHQFGDTVDHLCKAVLTGYGNGNLRRNPDGRQASDSAELRRQCRGIVDSARRALAKSIDELDLVHKSSSRNFGRKALSSGELSDALGNDASFKQRGVLQFFEDWLEREYINKQKEKAMQLSVGERFGRLVRVCWNVRLWLKIDADFDLFTGKQIERAKTEQRERHRKCLEAMNVALLNPDVKERLLRPGVADMLLEMLPEFDKWETYDKGVLYQEMLLYREKCDLIGRILQKGWERDQDFLPVALKLHRAVEIQTEALKKDAPEETKFVTRVKLNAYINMLQSIPSHQFRPDIISDKGEGLFRKDKEFKQMVEAADAIMGYRNDEIIGVLDNRSEGQGALTWARKVELIRGAFKDEKLEFEPQWEDVLDTSRAIGLLPQVVTSVRLEKVIFHKMDALPEPKPISSKDELSAALKMADEERSKGGFYMQFFFRRVPEVEARPLSEINSWEVHRTLLLDFFSVISTEHRDRTIVDLVVDSDAEPASNDTKEAAAVVTRHRQALEDEVILTLNRNRQLLDAEGRHCVNPRTSEEPDIKTFREAFKRQNTHEELITEVVVEEGAEGNNKGTTTARIVTVTEIKEVTQLRLAKYESLHDQMIQYLQKVKTHFLWSARVTQQIDRMIDGSCEQDNSEGEAGLKRQLERLRRDLFDYWQWVEERRARGAQTREAQAKTRELAAKDEENKAKQEARRVEEEAGRKQEEAKRIEDEALRKEAHAKAEEQAAKEQAGRAKEQEEKAKESEQNAIQRMKEAKRSEDQAKLREEEAKEKESKANRDMDEALEAKKKIEKEIADMRKQFETEKKENKKEITERDKEIKQLQKAKAEAEGREKKLKAEVEKLKQG